MLCCCRGLIRAILLFVVLLSGPSSAVQLGSRLLSREDGTAVCPPELQDFHALKLAGYFFLSQGQSRAAQECFSRGMQLYLSRVGRYEDTVADGGAPEGPPAGSDIARLQAQIAAISGGDAGDPVGTGFRSDAGDDPAADHLPPSSGIDPADQLRIDAEYDRQLRGQPLPRA